MTRRPFAQSSAQYLSDFAPDARLLRPAFDTEVYAVTPDGTYGTRPEWWNWPSHTAAEMGPPPTSQAELSVKSKIPRRSNTR
jgi:hypothetical protein